MKFSSSSSSLSSLVGGERKSTLCIYTEPEIAVKAKTDMESATLRQRLEAAEGALKLQTIRCCQLVTEYTGKLQRKDEQLCCEQQLREKQLSYVLQALRLFEERLQREQKNIRQLLLEKDNVITSQKAEILRLRSMPEEHNKDETPGKRYCDNCQIMFEAQNSLIRNTKSDCETETTTSFVDDVSSHSEASDTVCGMYSKNTKDSSRNVRRSKKYSLQRKQIGDARRLEPGPPFSSSSDEQDDRSIVTKEEETCFRRQPSFSNWVDSLHGIKTSNQKSVSSADKNTKNENEGIVSKSLLDETSENLNASTKSNEAKIDDNWYTNTSDAEDNSIPELYKDNPVLECVNQILLQNSIDVNSSEDSSPKLSAKRVQFAAQDVILKPPPAPKGIISNHSKTSESSPKSPKMVKFNLEAVHREREYDSPVECFNYELQSIYSNDYEPIINKSSQCSVNNGKEKIFRTDKEDHHYIDMDTTKSFQNLPDKTFLKQPPALPPKPPNLISKYKIQKTLEKNKLSSDVVECVQQINDAASTSPEPDYCSISEINEQPVGVFQTKPNIFVDPHVIETHVDVHESNVPIIKTAPITRVQTINIDHLLDSNDSKIPKYVSVDEIKLPQVSEIIIPKEDRYDHDNYIKNNSSLLKTNKSNQEEPVSLNTSNDVASNLTEIDENKIFTNIDTECKTSSDIVNNNGRLCKNNVGNSFENFDLSQTFEEFKLDEDDMNPIEVEEYVIEDSQDFVFHESDENEQQNENTEENLSDKMETYYNLSKNTLLASQFMRSQLIPNENKLETVQTILKDPTEVTKCLLQNDHENIENKNNYKDQINKNYETFLESSGLSSKSIQNLYKVSNMHIRVGGKSMNSIKPGTTVKYWSGPYL